MVLAAGVVFWLVRALLALVPHLALFWPIKKIAAGAAMAGRPPIVPFPAGTSLPSAA